MSNFWLNNPKVLFDNLNKLWPCSDMDFDEKLNAISRLIIILTIIGFLLTKTLKIIMTGIITLLVIVILYFIKSNKKKENLKNNIKEGFATFAKPLQEYKKIKSDNPLNNCNISDPTCDTPAPLAYEPDNIKKINKETKKWIFNTSFKDINEDTINKKIFKDLGDTVVFDNSMRNFYTTAATTRPNDQDSFAKYCYGDMTSCKDNQIFCKNNYRHILG